MIGNSSRAAQNNHNPKAGPVTTTWVPLGTPQANGVYTFNPLIAVQENPLVLPTGETAGESPGVSALNYFRGQYLQQLGLASNPACQFVLTDCGLGGASIAELSKGANPNIYNRLLQAAQYVQQTAASLGLTYQVGGMFWVQGEQDVSPLNTSQAEYLASLQQLQADFAADVVCGIGGAPSGTTVPWVSHQADGTTQTHMGVYNAEVQWGTTPGSDFYVASPTFCAVNHNVHLTANGYRQLGTQLGRAMAEVLLQGNLWQPLLMDTAVCQGQTMTITFANANGPLQVGTCYGSQYFGDPLGPYGYINYPNLGFAVQDESGSVPIVSATLVGGTTVVLQLKRALNGSATVQSGSDSSGRYRTGTNICDSDPTVALDLYTYTLGLQNIWEDIPLWNGLPIVGQPYPMNKYLAVYDMPVTQA
jgi:hypothetical protein